MSSSEPVGPPRMQAEEGIGRALLIGGIIGFVIVFGLVVAAVELVAHSGLASAIGAGVFVGSFGGIGFGAMTAGSMHYPSHSSGAHGDRAIEGERR